VLFPKGDEKKIAEGVFHTSVSRVLSSLMILVGGENRLVLGGCCGDRYSMHN
jgi:hypothetical protein